MKNCYYYFVFCCSLLLALLADASAHEQHQVTGNNKNDGAILTDHEEPPSPRTRIHLRGKKKQTTRGLFLSTYKLQNFQNNQCVGFGGGTPIKGTKAVFEPCASAPSFMYGGPDGRQLLVLFEDADYKNYNNNKKVRMCLDSIGNISLQPCRDHFSQVWLPSQIEGYDATSSRNGQTYYRFFNYGSGKWLDSDMKLVKEDATNAAANERQWLGGLDAAFIGLEQGST
jgi:hypothetical protein